jgi:hypothetical protein
MMRRDGLGVREGEDGGRREVREREERVGVGGGKEKRSRRVQSAWGR